jgi:uracil phosphoribosyltransferase
MRESLLTILRDEKTPVDQFRQAAHQLADLLAAEATAFVAEEPKMVKTPCGQAKGMEALQRVVLVPILRAGLAMLPSFLKIFPRASVGFFGIRRDEATAKPQLYYEELPALKSTDLIFILDPMIATAGSLLLAVDRLASRGASQIVLVGIIGATEGLEKLAFQHPDLDMIVAGEDPQLNSKKFIVPGLGDFGDRYFGN